jgi:multiple sugar transport system substrate-binding protein
MPEPSSTWTAQSPAATKPPTPTQSEIIADPWADVDPSGQTVLFWHPYSYASEKTLLKLIEEFNRMNTWGVYVRAEHPGSLGQIFKQMLEVLVTPDSPNLVMAYQEHAAAYQLSQGLVELDSLVESPKWGLSQDDQRDFFPGIWSQDLFPAYDNARLGIPLNRSVEVLYYNADWLSELKAAGEIEFEGPPITPEQFRAAACAAVKQPFSRSISAGSIGYELSISASRFATWTFAFGGEVYDYAYNLYTYNSDEAVAAMSFIQDLYAQGCASTAKQAYGDQDDFGAGKLLFSIGTSAGFPYYADSVDAGAGFEWGVTAVPHSTADPVVNVYGASLSIPQTTPEAELAAWLFIKYLISPEILAEWSGASNYLPVRASAARHLAELVGGSDSYQDLSALLAYARFEPSVPGYTVVRDLVAEALAAIASGADIVSTLKVLTEASNTILKEQD